MKNRRFRYHDNNKYIVILIVTSLFFMIVSIHFYQNLFLLILGMLLMAISIMGIYLISIAGIHINYKKGKIIIFDSLWFRTILINKVKYITVEEIKKVRKKKKHLFSKDSAYRAFWMESSTFVYRNGKTYDIIFHMNDGTKIKSYYGWLYNCRSKKRILRQEHKMNQMTQEILKYKNYKVNQKV